MRTLVGLLAGLAILSQPTFRGGIDLIRVDVSVVETAAAMVDELSPVDAVGLVPIPGKGVEIARDRRRVRDALAALKRAAPHTFQRHTLSVADAVAFEHCDRRFIADVIERECRQYEPECPLDLRNEAKQLLFDARRRQQVLMTTLGTLNTRLRMRLR